MSEEAASDPTHQQSDRELGEAFVTSRSALGNLGEVLLPPAPARLESVRYIAHHCRANGCLSGSKSQKQENIRGTRRHAAACCQITFALG